MARLDTILFSVTMMFVFLLLLLSSTLGKDIITKGALISNDEEIKWITDKPSLSKVVDAEVCDHTWMYYSQGTCHCGADIRGTVRCSTA